MKDCKIVINKSFYLGELKKYKLFKSAINLIKKDVVVYASDSEGIIFNKKDNHVKIVDIGIKKEYMKVSAKFSIPECIDTTFKQVNLEEAILMYAQEQEIWKEPIYHMDLFMLPFKVKVLTKDILIYPILKIFENNSVIISYQMYIDDECGIREFENVFADFNRHLFERISIPINYAPEHKEDDEIETIMDDEPVRYIEIDVNDERFCNIINFSWYLLNLLHKLEEPVTFYARCSYFIEKKNNRINKSFIDTLLKGVKGNYKLELKNYSINKDYKKYFNERASIVVGINAKYIESEIQAIEERMMLQVLKNSRIIENLKNDRYSYDELRKIYKETLYDNIEHRDSYYGEIEDALKLMLSFMKQEEKIELLKIGLEEKIKEKESYYQEKAALFALLLSASPLSEYIMFPIANNILHIEKIYNFIISLKDTWLNILLKKEYLQGLCFISTIALIYILYSNIIKKK